jgi:hypothetical protein
MSYRALGILAGMLDRDPGLIDKAGAILSREEWRVKRWRGRR